MASACNRRRQLLPAHQAAPPRRWTVEFARYMPTPRQGPSTALPPPGLRHISRGRLRGLRLRGAWLPSASPAVLRVSSAGSPYAAPVLTVSIGNVVYEEHYVSILNFSCPQITCMTQYPIRGSRVVLMSFCDMSKQECSSATMDIISSRSNYIYEGSSASEYITSNGLHHRLDEVACIDDPASGQWIDTLASGYHKETHAPVLEPSLVTNINSIYSGFPYSSSQMLTDCSTHNVKGEPFIMTTTVNAPEEVHTLCIPHGGKDNSMSCLFVSILLFSIRDMSVMFAAVVVASKEMTADKDNGADKDISDNYMACDSFHGM
ncbi:hypothetical protein GUJ93_ZPchr0006g42550 [Zizania palustris]|uniref:Poor homologous synapsis 1 PH domain-containing protein n=1 Tax=Zizania palustris TaxID=103762 RepID=A0A8J5TC94_ZIZPA|nr:hypothetical protein GUJ93_ZPchr0006g42550 [Zizania palustris]